MSCSDYIYIYINIDIKPLWVQKKLHLLISWAGQDVRETGTKSISVCVCVCAYTLNVTGSIPTCAVLKMKRVHIHTRIWPIQMSSVYSSAQKCVSERGLFVQATVE